MGAQLKIELGNAPNNRRLYHWFNPSTEAKKQIKNGVDPVFAKKQAKAEAVKNSTNTFKAIALEWHGQNKERWSKNYGYKVLKGLERNVLARTTIREKLDYDSEVIERQLAHKASGPLGEAYDRTQFLDKRKIMMQDWADYLDGIAQDGKVIAGNF